VKIREIRVSNSVASECGSANLDAMPIYEFHCEACNKDSEVLVRSSDWKGTLCPKCGSTRLEKKFSTFAASVAGGGAADLAGSCSGVPSSCGMCGTGKPHSH
jgi:putative FmdB family regulatory protein